jgi:hypothetical protein
MANLLAYRALALFSSAPTLRGLETTGWIARKSKPVFTWPIWEKPLSGEVIKSLLQLQNFMMRNLTVHGFGHEAS